MVIDRLPYSIEILLESAIHNCEEFQVEALFELIKGLIRILMGFLVMGLASLESSHLPIISSRTSDTFYNKMFSYVDEDDFKEEQNSVARLIQMLYNDDPEDFFKTIETLAGVPAPELTLLLYLQCAEAANDSDLEPVAYEFFTQAHILIPEQITALHLIIGTLQRMHIFVVENMDTLTHKPTGVLIFTSLLNPNLVPFHWTIFNKAFKKARSMQCCLCMLNLFWVDDHDNMKDGERYASIHMKSACFFVLQSMNDCQCLFVVDD
ncbi:hypothetical protein TanjilG_28412 [Lupinus angustifolius]|uniref:Uncharacterized protein n=1 Tax=Lupinus angustifolius TaxID=3871 RepID=A0A1J7GG97_LUPAN|nr:hypothetical protein TanjilG_28412 [Lupinus angustifolius]